MLDYGNFPWQDDYPQPHRSYTWPKTTGLFIDWDSRAQEGRDRFLAAGGNFIYPGLVKNENMDVQPMTNYRGGEIFMVRPNYSGAA